MAMIKSKQDGVSMIELLTVMGIVVVLTGIATLSFSTWVNKYDIERQVYVLYAQLLKTRTDAMYKKGHILWS
jgi:prepilin-type N-terminal cleavage/methylation domain-containing protein